MSDSERPFRLIHELTSNQNSLHAFIFSLVADREIAQELLQETNATICEKVDDFELGTHFLTWACTIARYKVLSFRRRAARERLVFDDRVFEQLASDVECAELDVAEKLKALDHCLEKLPLRQRDLARARYQPNASLQELAQASGQTRAALAVSLHRIRQTLLKCIERKLRKGLAE